MKRIYFLKPKCSDGPVKIGCSSAPSFRLQAINSCAPFELEIVASAPGGFDIERRIHRMFAECRSHSEWFNPSPALIAFVEHVKAHGVLPDVAPAPIKPPEEPRPRSVGGAKEKGWATRAINQAQVHAFGWWDRPALPAHIQEIRARYLAPGGTPPTAADWAAIEKFCAELRAKPKAPDACLRQREWLLFRRDNGPSLSKYYSAKLAQIEQGRAA